MINKYNISRYNEAQNDLCQSVMYKNNIKKRKTAFSLVEICIVCGIMAALLVPVFALLRQGNTVTVHNRNEILAREFVLNVISYCNLISYDKVRDYTSEELSNFPPLENEDGTFKIDVNNLGKNYEIFKSLNPEVSMVVDEVQPDNWSCKSRRIP